MRRAQSIKIVRRLPALAAGFAVAAAIGLQSSQATTPPQNITGGSTLTTGEELASPDGLFDFELNSSGNLVESFDNGGPTVWQTGQGTPGDEAVLQPSGDLQLIGSDGTVLWTTTTPTTGCPSMDVQDDGNVVIYGQSGQEPSWATGMVNALPSGAEMTAGQTLYPVGGEYYLTMQSDGNFVLYDNGNSSGASTGPIWATGTNGNTGDYAEMEPNGNLAVLSSAGAPLWSSNTATDSGAAGSSLQLESNGYIEIVSPSGSVLWTEPSSQPTSNGVDADPYGPSGSGIACPVTTTVTTPPTTPATTVTQTVTAAQTVPQTTQARRVKVAIRLKWSWSGPDTRLVSLKVGRLPSGAELTATYTGRRTARRSARTARQLRALIRWLEGAVYLRGDTLELAVSRPGYRSERASFAIRSGRLPKLTT